MYIKTNKKKKIKYDFNLSVIIYFFLFPDSEENFDIEDSEKHFFTADIY